MDSITRDCQYCGKPLNGAHFNRKYCVLCYKAARAERYKTYNAEWRKNNRQHKYKANKEWVEANPEKNKSSKAKYRQKNRNEINRKERERATKNKEHTRLRHQIYQRNNKGKVNARTRKRQAAKLQRTPFWLTDENHKQMADFYAVANDLGVEVDHIIPLQGKKVSGLHVPWNLQLMTAGDNRRKSNSF